MSCVHFHLLGSGCLFSLLLSSSALAAEQRFDFELSGRISIVKATLMTDGGSVNVRLKDERGKTAFASYQSELFGAEKHGGQFSFVRSKIIARIYFPTHGGDEDALIHLLRGASVATFGTADPKKLSVFSKEDPRSWDRFAMAALFRSALAPRILKAAKR